MNTENQRLMDLQIQRATEGLSPEETAELETLLQREGREAGNDIELTVAAVARAFEQGEGGDLAAPDHLKDRLARDAVTFFDARDNETVVSLESRRTTSRTDSSRTPLFGALGGAGWAMAAVLLLVILIGFLPDEPGPVPDIPVGLVEQRAALEAIDGTRVIAWATPEMPGFRQVSGDVVWNDERQEGYLRLSGLPVNDPASAQYQLWIVDPDVDEHPVDGGVFNMPVGVDEAIIPIDAKLIVDQPAAFAITLERPGGVVVSAGPLLVVATPG